MDTVIDLAARRHARASESSIDKKSSAVTAPPVSATIRSTTGLEGQPDPSQSCVTRPLDTPIRAANSRRLTLFDFNQSASFMTVIFSSSKISAQAKISSVVDGRRKHRPQNQGMPASDPGPFRPTFIRKWRKHRGQTLETLSAAAKMSVGNLSNIERGITGYNQETLEALAKALGCHPAELLIRDPDDQAPLWRLWEAADETQRRQIIAVVESLLRSTAA